ncbi:unnamed protein product, partial [marine sediment metagenome]
MGNGKGLGLIALLGLVLYMSKDKKVTNGFPSFPSLPTLPTLPTLPIELPPIVTDILNGNGLAKP